MKTSPSYSPIAAMIASVFTGLGTALIALVPSGSDTTTRVIIASIGSIITVLMPVVNAHHARTNAIHGLGQAVTSTGATALHVVQAPPARVVASKPPKQAGSGPVTTGKVR